MPTVLITGANRGIGLDLVKRYSKQGWDIIAAVRDPSTMPSVERVKVVKIVSDSETDAHDVAKELKAQGVTLDVVIANAAINTTKASFSELKTFELEHVFRTNVSGVMILFQAMKDLIPKGGKFTAISSGAGTINMPKAAGQPAYGLSKAALNFMIRSMHFENPDLVIVALNPGWVKTDMGNQGAIWSGMKEAPKSMDETIPGLMKNIENATRDNYGGYMIEWDGSRMEF